MDTFASLALATDPPTDKLLDRPPYSPKDSIVTPNMWRNIFGQSLYQILMLLFMLFQLPSTIGIPNSVGAEHYSHDKYIHFTMFFQTFVLMQVFNEMNARKLERSEVNVF
jgi:magnesium-transporting ATPase (P-type)